MNIGETELIYFVPGLADSHNVFYDGSVMIPVDGTYIYQVAGMPVAKSTFRAGDTIKFKLTFIFRIGGN